MKRGENWMNQFAEGMNLSSAPLPGTSLVEIYGCQRVLIENHMGISRYTQQEICVTVTYGHICVKGTGLELAKMTREQLVICGCVESVSLLRKGR